MVAGKFDARVRASLNNVALAAMLPEPLPAPGVGGKQRPEGRVLHPKVVEYSAEGKALNSAAPLAAEARVLDWARIPDGAEEAAQRDNCSAVL